MTESTHDKDDTLIDENEVEIPLQLPLLPARDAVFFSSMILPLFVGRKASILAVEEAMAQDRFIMLAAQKDQTVEDPGPDEVYEVGTLARIMRVLKLPDSQLKVLIQGIGRARITAYVRQTPSAIVRIERIIERESTRSGFEVEALMRNVRTLSEKILSLKDLLSPDVSAILDSIDSAGLLADLVTSNLRLKIDEAQAIFEIIDPVERLIKVNDYLIKELKVSTIQAKIQSDAQEEMSKSQREYFLREQMRAIRQELGDANDYTGELAEYKEKITAARMPDKIEEESLKQLARLEMMPRDAAEASMVRAYLECLIEIPWSKATRDKLDIKKAKQVLDQDHYGLDKVKDRILEYLAVRKLNKKMKGPILCFVGPPGVGKTSLGRSIARAMGRNFTRVSLGGMRDEAEIRGHRRTYIGALPGRIVQGLQNAGSNNPIFMLDEVDKIGSDFRGDPSSALLEVLDPEQNHSFSDHYLGVPLDLSRVMFITTANIIDPIPPALEDRMEIIRLPGYTEDEKLKIARNFLLPRQITDNGLSPADIHLSDQAILKVITEYTEEAGVRNLERRLGTVLRKIARRKAEGDTGPFKVSGTSLYRYLGAPEFLPEPAQEQEDIGVAVGLAWTQAGGELLYIEAAAMPGKGGLTLTGQLGEIMKESAQAALSLARARAEKLGLDPEFHENMDIHIHIPAGAVPKDGPSAGVTMTAAMISALSGRPVPKDLAMTGEITLRGKILAIGGLKEKSLAALRADHIRRVIIPEQNNKDLLELPPKVRRSLEFILVRDLDQFLDLVFPPSSPKTGKGKKSRPDKVRSSISKQDK